MHKASLRAKTRRGFRPCRNSGSKAVGVAENLLQQEFSPATPNRCWAGDITYIRTSSGWRYLAVWIDLYSRRVVGWAMAPPWFWKPSTGPWASARSNPINSQGRLKVHSSRLRQADADPSRAFG